MESSFPENFARLREAIFARRPTLQDIIMKHGDKSLHAYAQEYLDINLTPVAIRRQEGFLEVFSKEAERLFGQEIAVGAVEQLRRHYFVSTADHHGPVTHPFFLNSNLIIGASYDQHPDPFLKYVIVLSCANVSLNNSSFPRGLLFTSEYVPDGPALRLSFLPSTAHSSAVYNFRPYTSQEVLKIRKNLQEQQTKKLISSTTAQKLNTLLDDVYDKSEILASESFSDQVSRTNIGLWRAYLQNSHRPAPDLLYVEQEHLISRFLCEYHLDNQSTINFLLFGDRAEEMIYKHFEGIMGAFSRAEKWGTYLFWGIDPKSNRRLHLWKQGNFLVTDDGGFRVELTPAAIRTALQNGQIIPGMMLICVMIAFYYGLKCLGGCNQVHYLTLLKKAYLGMCADIGDTESLAVCEPVQTKEFVDGPRVAFLETIDKKILPVNGLDFYLHHSDNAWDKIVQATRNITLEEAFNTCLPDFYPVMYPEVERLPELSALTAGEITAYMGLDKKLKPCISLES